MRLIVSLSLCGLLFAFNAFATDYWIAMGNGRIDNDQSGIYIIRINDKGQIVSPVKNVWPNTPFNDGVPSLTVGSNNQLMVVELFLLLNDFTHPNASVTVITLTLNKNTLAATGLNTTGIQHKDGFWIQSSQKPVENLFAIRPGSSINDDPKGYGFDPLGNITGSWRLIPRIKNLATDAG